MQCVTILDLLSLVDVGAVSRFKFLQMSLPWTFLNGFSVAHVHKSSSLVSLGDKLLAPRRCAGFHLLSRAKLISKVVESTTLLTIKYLRVLVGTCRYQPLQSLLSKSEWSYISLRLCICISCEGECLFIWLITCVSSLQVPVPAFAHLPRSWISVLICCLSSYMFTGIPYIFSFVHLWCFKCCLLFSLSTYSLLKKNVHNLNVTEVINCFWCDLHCFSCKKLALISY